ncbi:hypothetical protein J6590_012148 [Homalodisca vitripennis]|nr:hypothetical protein J6590_012148 [Homalodisca vitripennis]
MTLKANIAHATDNSTDGETSATETTANTNTSNFLDLRHRKEVQNKDFLEHDLSNKKPTQRLIIFHQNIDRISNKIERLQHLLYTKPADIVVLTEHGLKQTISHLRLSNYSSVCAYGRTEHIKGGVAIYKHNKLANKTTSLNLEKYSVEMVCEVTGITIKISNKIDLHILGYYRPPNVNIETTLQVLDDTITEVHTNNSYIIVTGDINNDNLTNCYWYNIYSLLRTSFTK